MINNENLLKLGIKQRASLLVKKLSHEYPKTPETNLMFAVFERAVLDYADSFCNSAKSYLEGSLFHVELIGIDPEYVRRLLNDMKIIEVRRG